MEQHCSTVETKWQKPRTKFVYRFNVVYIVVLLLLLLLNFSLLNQIEGKYWNYLNKWRKINKNRHKSKWSFLLCINNFPIFLQSHRVTAAKNNKHTHTFAHIWYAHIKVHWKIAQIEERKLNQSIFSKISYVRTI